MTTPRIGDTVHYRVRLKPRCDAATVTNLNPLGGRYGVDLKVAHPTGADYLTHNTAYDHDAEQGGFTPGTWHHTH